MKEKEKKPETITKKACATEVKKLIINEKKQNTINIASVFLIYASTIINETAGVITTMLYIGYNFIKITKNKQDIKHLEDKYHV